MKIQKQKVRALIGCLLGMVLVTNLMSPPLQSVAFDKVWSFTSCTGVSSSERGFWDDAPGAGTNNESAFLWLLTNSSDNERCTAAAAGGGTNTTTYPQLRIRLAVNDGAIFKVDLRSGSEFCGGGVSIASITTTSSEDSSAFITKQITLPSGQSVGEVCITFDDDPDNVGSERASVLIDDIRLWNSASGVIGWQERFTRSN